MGERGARSDMLLIVLELIVGVERREARGHVLGEEAHRAVALLAGYPVLPDQQHEDAEAAGVLEDLLQASVHRVGITDAEVAVIDHEVEGDVLAAPALRDEWIV